MIVRPLLLLAAAACATACWVDPDPAPRATYTPATTAPAPSGSASTSTTAPLLVKVDTGRTLNAAAGEGVGIFVEYATNGTWHVWWTCDTRQTGASCGFDIRIKSESGDLESVHSEGVLSGDSISSSDPRTITATSTTGDNIVGVRFEGPSHGIISVDASVGGVPSPAYFFFVQDGKPNGGYSGLLSNPLRFQGATP